MSRPWSRTTPRGRRTQSSQCGRQRFRHALLRVAIEAGEERQRERATAQIFRYRAHALAEAVALAHVRLQVDGRQIAVEADLLALEVRNHALARLVVRQDDDIDEPRAAVRLVIGARQLDAVDPSEQLAVPPSHLAAEPEHLVEPFDLREPERGSDVRHAVVEPEPHVLEPAAAVP